MAGRPREFDKELALKKARDLFWQYGFEGTSMSDLVQTLGIASARIYAAFGSKEALFREAVADYQIEKGTYAQNVFSNTGELRSALETMLRSAVDVYTAKQLGCMVVSSAVNYSGKNQGIAKWLSNLRNERTNMVIDRLRRGKKKGELPEAFDEIAFGDFFTTAIHGFSVQARDGVAKSRLNAVVDLVLQAYDAAVAAASL